VYSTSNIGGVTAVDADTGTYLWSSVTDGLVQGAPVAIANSVFIGSLAGDVVSYDVNYQGSSASGNPAWLNKANSIDKFVVGNSSLTPKPKLRALGARRRASALTPCTQMAPSEPRSTKLNSLIRLR
jgi:outer membrane protein assembly factor BamB